MLAQIGVKPEKIRIVEGASCSGGAGAGCAAVEWWGEKSRFKT